MIKSTEISALAAFLRSDLAASITGAEMLVDGGQTPAGGRNPDLQRNHLSGRI